MNKIIESYFTTDSDVERKRSNFYCRLSLLRKYYANFDRFVNDFISKIEIMIPLLKDIDAKSNVIFINLNLIFYF